LLKRFAPQSGEKTVLTKVKLFPLVCLLALPGCVALAQEERTVMPPRAITSAQESE